MSNVPEIKKIALTGGPCAGKTTAMSWIQNAFERLGYRVLFIPETATEMIIAGVREECFSRDYDYQICQMRMQIAKEKVYERTAASMDAKKVLIVCDRGTPDNKAYMPEEEYRQILQELRVSEIDLRDSYDAVFHMVTAASGAEEFYTLANNEARSEAPEDAIKLDDRLIEAWTGHPYLRIIDNSTGYQAKLQRLLEEISAFLGESASFKEGQRFLIEYPDTARLEALPNCCRVDIVQTYLKSDKANEPSIRRRGMNGSFLYYKSEKVQTGSGSSIETEERLTQYEYQTLIAQADPSLRQIRMSRYYLSEGNRYYKIDVFPRWKDRAVMETGRRRACEELQTPDFVRVIREIDGEEYEGLDLAKQE